MMMIIITIIIIIVKKSALSSKSLESAVGYAGEGAGRSNIQVIYKTINNINIAIQLLIFKY